MENSSCQTLGLTSIADTLIFGGLGGSFSQINDTGDQMVIFRGGNKVDSIQIGNTRYGGGGGGEKGRAKLPPTGKFRLLEIRAGDKNVISYLKVEIAGDTIEVGTKHDGHVILNVDLQVKFTGISHGNVIDRI